MWNLSGKQIQNYVGHKDVVVSVSFSSNGEYILSGSLDKTARVWDLSGKEIIALKNQRSTISYTSFLPDCKTILIASEDKTIHIWDANGTLLQIIECFKNDISSDAYLTNTERFEDEKPYFYVTLSPNGRNMLTSSEEDNVVRLWDVRGNLLQSFKGYNKWINRKK